MRRSPLHVEVPHVRIVAQRAGRRSDVRRRRPSPNARAPAVGPMSLDVAIAGAIANEVARLLRDLVPTGSPDDLVELPGPLQRRTAMALVRTGKLPARKLGQHWYTLRKHLTALVDEESKPIDGFDPKRAIADHIIRKSRHG